MLNFVGFTFLRFLLVDQVDLEDDLLTLKDS